MKIDFWTLGLQTVNVLVLTGLLHRLLYKPVRQMLTERQRRIAEQLAAASSALAQADATRKALDEEHAGIAAARQRAEAEARTSARTERERILADAEREAAANTAAARTALDAERQAAATAFTQEASSVAVAIARRLLERAPRAALTGAFIEGACAELARVPDLGGARDGGEIELASAELLTDPEQALCRERLAAVLGAPPRLRFTVDETLIAGIELRLPHAVVRNHWGRDLAGILEALHADERAA